MSIDRARRTAQRGSALLIVFLFAAIVAILLYRELPTVAFEARRQKEQLLIDRGNEYKHAVKLYYRKVGGYPGSIEQLENTNRMRFLRHRYKDPFTEKDDWRLLHMGPGNMLLDSKVNPLKTGGQAGPMGASAGFSGNSTVSTTSAFGSGTNNSSSFGSNTSGFVGLSSSGSNSQPTVKVPSVRQRGPAIPAGEGTGGDNSADNLSAQEASPMPPEMPESLPSTMEQARVQAGPSGSQGNGVPSNSQAPGANATQMVQGLFNNQSSRQGINSSRMGTMQGGGGIAGVASKASGDSIKTVNDQSDYALWEFYYDPSKDVQPGLAGGTQAAGNPTGTGASTQASTPGTSGNGFQSNSFSLGNSFGSEKGASSNSTPGNTMSSGRLSSPAQNGPQ